MIRRLRVCAACEMTFETGNKLRQHRRRFHPPLPGQRAHNTKILKNYRREALIKLIRGTT